jgi:hypothetical protein
MTRVSVIGKLGLIEKGGYANQHHKIYGETQTKGIAPPMIDYLQMSSGETWAQLLKAQADMLALSYPSLKVNFEGTQINPYAQAGMLINDAIYKGLHNNLDVARFDRLATVTGGHFDGLAQAIRLAKNMAAPASDLIMLKDRNSLLQGIDPMKQIGEIVTLDNCQRFSLARGASGGDTRMFSTETHQMEWFNSLGTDANCLTRIEYRKAFNEALPNSSHQLIYNWVTDDFLRQGLKGQLDSVAIAQIVNKATWHRGGIEVFANVSTINKQLIAEWVKTSIMGANQRIGLAPMTPEEILVLMRDTPEGWGINVEKGDPGKDFKVGAIPFLVALGVFILSCLIGVAGLIQVLQGKEPTAFRYATDLFQKVLSPSPSDFNIPNITLPTGTGTGNNPIPCPAGYTRNAQGQCVKTTTGAGSGMSQNTMIAIGAGAVLLGGLYLATKDDNKKA